MRSSISRIGTVSKAENSCSRGAPVHDGTCFLKVMVFLLLEGTSLGGLHSIYLVFSPTL